MTSNSGSTSCAAFLALTTGQIDRHLQQQVEFVLAENRILRSRIEGRVRLDDPQRISLATIANPNPTSPVMGRFSVANDSEDLLKHYHRKHAA